VTRPALATTALVIIAMLLAIALFVAGAMWRARVAVSFATPEPTAYLRVAGSESGRPQGRMILTNRSADLA
jgi:hypothetical protein